MGTWGVHSFENDDAVEWAAAYREMGLSVAASTIRVALDDHSNNRLSAEIATRAIAAAEAVAHALGRGSADARRLFDGAPAEDRAAAETLVPDADELLTSVTTGTELAQLWKAVGAAEESAWHASLNELRTRLKGAPARKPAAPAAEVSAEAAAPEDVHAAIAELSRDIDLLRREMSENFARLAARIERMGGGGQA